MNYHKINSFFTRTIGFLFLSLSAYGADGSAPPLDIRFGALAKTAVSATKFIRVVLNPLAGDSSVDMERVSSLLAPHTDSESLLSHAPAFVGEGPSVPHLKTEESKTIGEVFVRAAMQERPQYFSPLVEDGDVPADAPLRAFGSFVKEIAQGGALHALASLLKETMGTGGGEEAHSTSQEFIDVGSSFIKGITSENPFENPLNKYVDKKDFEEACVLQDWLEKNRGHAKYDSKQRKLERRNKRIMAARDRALEEGVNYMSGLLGRMNPDLAGLEMPARMAKHQRDWAIQKRGYFERYIIEDLEKRDEIEPNILRHFWEIVERNQYGETFYTIVCESLLPENADSEVHRRSQNLWALSIIDTINISHLDARSRMPSESIGGAASSHFGYRMDTASSYKQWIANPLVKACGDVIMDAFYAAVDFGRNLDIGKFLERLTLHLDDRDTYVKTQTEIDSFIIPFERFLLENLGQPFVRGEGVTIPGKLERIIGSRDALMKETQETLEKLKSFSARMFDIRPSMVDTSRSFTGLVLGIGFNGPLFDSPDFFKKGNEIWVSFAQSGREVGGNLLLKFMGQIASLKSPPHVFVDESFARYKSLIRNHVKKQIRDLYDFPDSHWDNDTLEHISNERKKFEGFMSQLEQDIPFAYLDEKLRNWIRSTSNWYKVPYGVDIQIPNEMPEPELRAQHFSRELVFDALNHRHFSREREDLMPNLFLHWKDRLLEHISIDRPEYSLIKSVTTLGDLDGPSKTLALEELNKLVWQVHGEVRDVWSPQIDDFFEENVVKPIKSPKEEQLRDLSRKIKLSEKKITGLGKSKADVSDEERALSELIGQKSYLEEQIGALPKLPSDLTLDRYKSFREVFFEKRNPSQCVEPSFARVMGHDHFFSVYLSPAMPKGPITGSDGIPFQLGNGVHSYIIEPCLPRCQCHVVGHLYTGDMLSYQSADRLDEMRHSHGAGSVPNRIMTFSEFDELSRRL